GIKDTPLQAVAPLRFMRELLCMSGRSIFRPTCKNKVAFDAWAVHPYTPGGPTRHATQRDDVALGDMPEVRGLLDAAVRAGHVVSRSKPELWVTELAWETSQPDRSAFVVLFTLHAA